MEFIHLLGGLLGGLFVFFIFFLMLYGPYYLFVAPLLVNDINYLGKDSDVSMLINVPDNISKKQAFDIVFNYCKRNNFQIYAFDNHRLEMVANDVRYSVWRKLVKVIQKDNVIYVHIGIIADGTIFNVLIKSFTFNGSKQFLFQKIDYFANSIRENLFQYSIKNQNINSDSIFCSNCGNKCNKSVNFCPKCGSQINAQSDLELNNQLDNKHTIEQNKILHKKDSELKEEVVIKPYDFNTHDIYENKQTEENNELYEEDISRESSSGSLYFALFLLLIIMIAFVKFLE